MNRTDFHLSMQGLIVNALLVAGLLLFVWLHWRGERQTELIIFSILAILATSLYTIRSELSVADTSRELTVQHLWLGIPLSKTIVRIGRDDSLRLTEDILYHRKGQGATIAHGLEATGQMISASTSVPGSHELKTVADAGHKAKLDKFARQAADTLSIDLHDEREFTSPFRRYV